VRMRRCACRQRIEGNAEEQVLSMQHVDCDGRLLLCSELSRQLQLGDRVHFLPMLCVCALAACAHGLDVHCWARRDWSFGRCAAIFLDGPRKGESIPTTPRTSGPTTPRTSGPDGSSAEHSPSAQMPVDSSDESGNHFSGSRGALAKGYSQHAATVVEGKSIVGPGSNTQQPPAVSFVSEPRDGSFAGPRIGPVPAPSFEAGTERPLSGSPRRHTGALSRCTPSGSRASQGRMPGERGWICGGSARETSLLRVPPKNGPIVLQKAVRCQGLYGIGMAIDLDEGAPRVVRKVIDLRNGADQVINFAVKEGDILLAVNGLSVEQSHGKALSENLLWGAQNSQVKLTLQSANQDRYIVLCKRHVPIRSWDIAEVSFGLSCEAQATNSEREFVVGEKVVELLNQMRRTVVDESGEAIDWLQPLQDWQVTS
jgi:hypothetical protein